MNFVKIKKQNWASVNLSAIKFQNGDPINYAQSDKEWQKAAEMEAPAYCYPEVNGELIIEEGCLYNWFAVNDPRGLAPIGWRIPTIQDIKLLEVMLDGHRGAPKYLKSTSGWDDIDLGQSGKVISGNGIDAYGFNAKPTYTRYINQEDLIPANSHASYWLLNDNILDYDLDNDSSKTHSIIFSIGDYLNHYLYGDSLFVLPVNKLTGLPVRCLYGKNASLERPELEYTIPSEVQSTYLSEQIKSIVKYNFPELLIKSRGDF